MISDRAPRPAEIDVTERDDDVPLGDSPDVAVPLAAAADGRDPDALTGWRLGAAADHVRGNDHGSRGSLAEEPSSANR